MHAGEYDWFAWICKYVLGEATSHLPRRFQYAPHITWSIRWTLCKGDLESPSLPHILIKTITHGN